MEKLDFIGGMIRLASIAIVISALFLTAKGMETLGEIGLAKMESIQPLPAPTGLFVSIGTTRIN